MTAYYNEFDPKAAAWLRELIHCGLIADGVVDERSILEVRPEDLRGFTQCHFFAGVGGWSYALRLAGWPDDRPVWTGSPPCQPFSSAGQQKGQKDERHLAPHFAALVAECRPPVLFGEQVASAAVFGKAAKRTGKAADGGAAPEWAWLDDLSERLEAAHYACGASDIPAAGVGAAHIRQRTFFGATRMDDPASARHNGPLVGAEGLARNETWLRLSGARSRLDGLGNASDIRSGDGTSDRGLGSPQRPFDREAREGDGQTLRVASGAVRLGHATSGRERARFADDGRSGRDEGSDRTASDVDRLADADGEQRRQGLQSLPRRSPERVGCGGQFDGLADSIDARSQGRLRGRRDTQRPDQHGYTGRDGSTIGLEHSAGDGREQWRPEPSGRGATSGCSDGGLADAEHAERRPICQHGEDGRDGANSGREETHGVTGTRGEVCERPNATDSPWATADWLFCRDGKWRPVEPSTFPLANGVSARVGRLRGYGNAIVPQAAAEFVKAFDAANNECFRLIEAIDAGVFG